MVHELGFHFFNPHLRLLQDVPQHYISFHEFALPGRVHGIPNLPVPYIGGKGEGEILSKIIPYLT